MTRWQFIIILLIFVKTPALCQNDYLDTLSKEKGYVHSIVKSPHSSYIGFGVASFQQKVVDSNYNEVITIPLNALWGGGGITFSADEKLVGYYAYGDLDTLKVRAIKSTDISVMLFNDILGIKFTAENDIMFVYGEDFLYLINVQKQRVIKKKAVKSGIYAAAFDGHTNTIYVLTEGKVLAFSSKNLKFKSEVVETTSKSTRLWVKNGLIAVENDDKLELYSHKTASKITEIDPNLGYITDVLLEPENVIVCGRKPELFIHNLTDQNSYQIKLFVNERGIFGIARNHRNQVVVGDANYLYLIPN